MATLDINFVVDPTTREISIELDNPGGKYKMLGKHRMGNGDNGTGTDWTYGIMVQVTTGGNADPLVIAAADIESGHVFKSQPSSSDELDVWVLEYASSGGGHVRNTKKAKSTRN